MKHISIIILSIFSLGLCAQSSQVELEGVVSYVTSQSVYVKFASTEQIEAGDTLFWNVLDEKIPCLIVKNKSSVSVVCGLLNECTIKTESKVTFLPHRLKVEQLQEDTSTASVELPEKKERIRGRISAASYSNIFDDRSPSHRAMYRFSMNADNINESKFSLETYLNYRQLFVDQERSSIRRTKYFNVFNLAVRYDLDSTMSLTFGRKINNKASSLGAIDGLQAEKYFGDIYTGLIVGFRPDLSDYSLNTNLLEYGAYAGLQKDGKKVRSRTTLGLLQQNNSGAIDRRYIYFQHSSTINRKLTLFSSAELDLYNEIDGQSISNGRLTNFFTSARYRFSRKIDLNLSYDSRRRIMYYETFRSEVERLLEDDEARQGLRTRVNVRPFKYTSFGLSYSKRFQSSRQNKSDNINGYISYTKLPTIGGRTSLNYNRNESNYLLSQVASVRYSRELIKSKLSADFYYRMVNYTYNTASEITSSTSEQYYYGANFLYRFTRTLTFSLMGELATRGEENNYRVNTRIIKRFDSKKSRVTARKQYLVRKKKGDKVISRTKEIESQD
jgi:hypothetical protein